MENLAYYNSSILDINSQDDLLDQTDIMRKNNLQYQCDSIIETIGIQQCKVNIHLFLDDIEKALDEEALESFYFDIFVKLIDVYHLGVLEDHRDMKKSMSYSKQVKKLLLFLEVDYINFLAKILRDVPIGEVLEMRPFYESLYQVYPNIRRRINESQKEITGLYQYFFIMAARDDLNYAITKLVFKNTATLISELFILRGGQEQ